MRILQAQKCYPSIGRTPNRADFALWPRPLHLTLTPHVAIPRPTPPGQECSKGKRALSGAWGVLLCPLAFPRARSESVALLAHRPAPCAPAAPRPVGLTHTCCCCEPCGSRASPPATSAPSVPAVCQTDQNHPKATTCRPSDDYSPECDGGLTPLGTFFPVQSPNPRRTLELLSPETT